ncbi:UDP-2,4-diacetamido-2,4,6-trideoxy-beta-L-altropyranose hydrolase [Anaeromusa acidaminophila]|uniref:UDP-2,4-diacetamido-2,4, 6-trideoxy-beta-L-altropyranose hydrolase n=1 Tax=Anaeromusa acidaminophila TaxID=81464 RepID=UPI00036175DE|nr:UDP-2,4-diacetamido-2,4,6-trideoxy-beta-L-altropyranose hydrolase [Anaeromusa acidaminophila]
MKVVFRADASVEIGTGHVMRCLAFAEELQCHGIQVQFACVEQPGHLIRMIRDKGYTCYALKAIDEVLTICGDWLVVDHYQLDLTWESAMRKQFRHIMVIDDLADRQHNCDILLDQNDYLQDKTRYEALIPRNCASFLGPGYALFRREFIQVKGKLGSRGIEKVQRILLSFGGTDPAGMTWKFLQWWSQAEFAQNREMHLIVVIGHYCVNRDKIEQYCHENENVTLHIQTSKMAQLLCEADIAIGAGGVSLWERCYLGVPSITVVVAENQKAIAEKAAEDGLTLLAGTAQQDNLERIEALLTQLIEDRALRLQMKENMQALYPEKDKHGVGEIVRTMEELNHAG